MPSLGDEDEDSVVEEDLYSVEVSAGGRPCFRHGKVVTPLIDCHWEFESPESDEPSISTDGAFAPASGALDDRQLKALLRSGPEQEEKRLDKWLAETHDSPKPHVHIPDVGLINGLISSEHPGVAIFRGIPYAKPPIGPLRWQPPQMHGPLESPFDATGDPPGCVQKKHHRWYQMPTTHSEDCLFVHIAAPLSSLNTNKSLPVMIWIHGGGYSMGSGSRDLLYPGYFPTDALVAAGKKEVIVLSMNYRLGIFGFLGSDELKRDSHDGSTGNYGIADQRLAMQWAQKYIARFGGNPNKVTIFGQSAGGNSVYNHIAQKASFPFYQQAVIMSGAYDKGATTMDKANAVYKKILHITECQDLSCLRGVDAETIFHSVTTGLTNSPFTPLVDGVVLEGTPADLIIGGDYNNKVPIVIGSTSDENALFFTPAQSGNETSHGFDKFLNNLTYPRLDGVWAPANSRSITARSDMTERNEQLRAIYDRQNHQYHYPADLGNMTSYYWEEMRMLTDMVPGLGACGTRWLAKYLTTRGSPAVYEYVFSRRSSTPPLSDGVTVPHGAELAYVFGNMSGLHSDEDRHLAMQTATYWTSFAISGVPGGGLNLPEWPKWEVSSDMIMRLDVPQPALSGEYRKVACDYWEDLYEKGGRPHCGKHGC